MLQILPGLCITPWSAHSVLCEPHGQFCRREGDLLLGHPGHVLLLASPAVDSFEVC